MKQGKLNMESMFLYMVFAVVSTNVLFFNDSESSFLVCCTPQKTIFCIHQTKIMTEIHVYEMIQYKRTTEVGSPVLRKPILPKGFSHS